MKTKTLENKKGEVMSKIVKTDDELKKTALEAGLKMFGLPNRRLTNSSYDIVERDAAAFGINLDDYKLIQESHGEMSSGLIWGDYKVERLSMKAMIKENLEDALENFLCIGDFEFIFYPHSPEKELVDWSATQCFLNERIRDTDGYVYTVCGEADAILIIDVDCGLTEAIDMFKEVFKKDVEEGYSEDPRDFDILGRGIMATLSEEPYFG